jgi:hypothetical protein
MYKRLRSGDFGNALRTWDSLKAQRADHYYGELSLRCKDRIEGPSLVGVPAIPTALTLRRLLQFANYHGLEEDEIMLGERAPDHRITIQGEVMTGLYGPELRYSCLQTHMRAAMREDCHAYGLAALTILQDHLSPSSYEDLQALLELYPDHVIEFTTFDGPVGSLPGRNTVIWEVRLY